LLYGNEIREFEDLAFQEDESGELKLMPVVRKVKVFEKVYMALQEDEMQFANEDFRTLYYQLIDAFYQEVEFSTVEFIKNLNQDLAAIVTSILMEEERYTLHDWERNQIVPKEKHQTISQFVDQTILSLRCYLIDKKIAEYKSEVLKKEVDTRVILEDIKDYIELKKLLSGKLGKVVGSVV